MAILIDPVILNIIFNTETTIKDAIIDYLETVEELTKNKESRYVEIASHA